MSNNLPLYPLLRNGRNIDIIICFDASADVKEENWLSVTDDYARQRGVKGWPIGAGWPKVKDDTKKELDAADAVTAQEAAGHIVDEREGHRTSRNAVGSDIAKNDHQGGQETLGYCNVWVGNTQEEPSELDISQKKPLDLESESKLLDPHAGIAVVYFPFLSNPKVKDIDPNTSTYLSTWNFIYTPEQVDKVVELARTNFEAGREQTKRTIRAVYERKKARRLGLAEELRIRRWKKELRERGDHFQ